MREAARGRSLSTLSLIRYANIRFSSPTHRRLIQRHSRSGSSRLYCLRCASLPLHGRGRENGPRRRGRQTPTYSCHAGNRRHSLCLGCLRSGGGRSYRPSAIRQARTPCHLCSVSGPGGRLSASQAGLPWKLRDLLACLIWHLSCYRVGARLRRHFALVGAVRLARACRGNECHHFRRTLSRNVSQ